jgi:glutathione S-transferase
VSARDTGPYTSYAAHVAPAPGHYRLLGADVSYYSAKLDAWLAFKRIPHHRELATREVFAREILPRVGYPVIPVLIAPDDTTLQDTSEIIDTLEARFPSPPTLPETPAARFLCLLFELYCDEWIKVPALHYRWHYDAGFAALEFGRNNDPDESPARQFETGRKIAARFSGWCGPLGVSAATIPAIEADYHALLALLDQHLATSPTLLGGPPSLCDFALYGPFHAHLLRDPVSSRVMRERAPAVVRYLERLRACPPAVAGPLEIDVDALPETLWAVLRLLSRDYVPVLAAQHRAVCEWLARTGEGELPRSIGSQPVVFGRGTPHEAVGQRDVFTYDSWMLGRVLAVVDAAGSADRDVIARVAARADATALLGLERLPGLRRERFRLVYRTG